MAPPTGGAEIGTDCRRQAAPFGLVCPLSPRPRPRDRRYRHCRHGRLLDPPCSSHLLKPPILFKRAWVWSST